MQDIRIHTIPHEMHRYPTTGDWVVNPDGSLDIYVSDLGSPDAEFLVAMHELTEAWLFLRKGGTQEEADAWDITHPELLEPGCDPHAPYHSEHEAGEVIERVLAPLMGWDWHEYDNTFNKLDWSHDGTEPGHAS